MSKTKIGIIGCGNISPNYLKHAKIFSDTIEIKALADLNLELAQERAKEFEIPVACSVEELLADDEIKIVANLTIPQVHGLVAKQIIAAGKSVWNEKPLALDVAEGKEVLEAAEAAGVLVGCAPDTFLGSAHQAAREILDAGKIGRPVCGTAFMMGAGHESWHPAPEFYYKIGGGPMFDMGPYYLTALVNLLGPMKRVTGFASITRPQREITSEPKKGQIIDVETPDHVAGTIEFVSGSIVTIITSFAAYYSSLPRIVIYGDQGTLEVEDPNVFDDKGETTRYRRAGDEDWTMADIKHDLGWGRSAGMADMALALKTGKPHRASGKLAYHVLEAMQGFLDSSEQGKAIELDTTGLERPAAITSGLGAGVID